VKRLVALALLLCACKGRPAVPLLTWHAVAEHGDEFTVPPELFERQLDALMPWHTVSIHDAMTAPPARALVLTFDDGSRDALEVVLPALQKRGMHATFFIVTGSVGKPGFLDWQGVAALKAAGMEIGSHSVTHPRLPEVPQAKLRLELRESRRVLELHLRAPCEVFAYPYNALRSREEDAVRAAGYKWAVAGVAHGGSDPLALYRIPVKRDTSPEALVSELRK
jgi:peptidoglycan/xylan/chitin deacetylase (PgdA/CDA1 family)